jgi:membrane-bound lytic murein transglycosylase D
MKKIFIIYLIIFSSFSCASLTHNFYSQKDLGVMKQFDIEDTFIKDPVFHKMIANIENNMKNKFIQRLDKAYLFIPTMKRLLKEAGLPPAFLYLAMAESNFSIRAYSRKKAVGLWQFMPATAKRFGLKIDSYVDERRDIIKSTEVAIKYLKYLHKKFDKWYLAALAYNCGEGRLRQGIKMAKSSDLTDLLKVYKYKRKQYLPRETRFYIRKILSLAIMAERPDFLINDDSAHLLNRGMASSISQVKVKGGIHLKDVAKNMSIPLQELIDLNRHLSHQLTPAYLEETNIYIPYTRLSYFLGNQDKLNLTKTKLLIYKVKSGDSLYKVGKKFNIPYRMIKDFNKLNSNILSLNQKLIIPIVQIGKTVLDRRKKLNKNNEYIVKRGDTISRISQIFNVSISSILNKNNMLNSNIKIGEKLVIPN